MICIFQGGPFNKTVLCKPAHSIDYVNGRILPPTCIGCRVELIFIKIFSVDDSSGRWLGALRYDLMDKNQQDIVKLIQNYYNKEDIK